MESTFGNLIVTSQLIFVFYLIFGVTTSMPYTTTRASAKSRVRVYLCSCRKVKKENINENSEPE